MKKSLIAFATLALLSCERQAADSEPTSDCVENYNPAIMCTQQYDPVCGCNGKTYGNDCMALAAGIRVVAKGECRK